MEITLLITLIIFRHFLFWERFHLAMEDERIRDMLLYHRGLGAICIQVTLKFNGRHDTAQAVVKTRGKRDNVA